jgi:hypothetical protein
MDSLEECPICTKPIPSNIDNVKTVAVIHFVLAVL